MELLQLKYFYESAINENFTKTAEKYMVPISSVSASVRRLEEELGCKLFDRTSNRITLNGNGKRFQKSLCLVFQELEGAVDDLSVSVTDTSEIKMLVRAMRSKITDYIVEYNKKHPHIAFKIVFDFEETNLGDYDIIIDEKNDRYADFECYEQFNMRIGMMASYNNPISGKNLTLKQLCNQPFVSLSENSNMHKMLVKYCRIAGFTPNIVAQINDIGCHEKLIEAGMGIGLGKMPVKPDDTGKIKFLNVTDFNERYVVYTYFKNRNDGGNVEHFLKFLKSKFDIYFEHV